MVHRREVDGAEIVFGNQGALYKDAMTWWDHDTGSVWSQPLGEAILGPRKGEKLELLPSTLTDWGSWRAAHPETLALDFDAGSAGFDPSEMVIVVELNGAATGYTMPAVQQAGVVNDSVGGEPVAIVVDARDTSVWSVFSRRVAGRVLEFEIESGSLIDTATRTRWDPVRGPALSGPLRGESLPTLPAFTIFPDRFHNFFPDGELRPDEQATGGR